jgi:hypothetical protein
MTSTISCLHSWTTESTHRTSEGTVTYERCSCGARRVQQRGEIVHDYRVNSPITSTWWVNGNASNARRSVSR